MLFARKDLSGLVAEPFDPCCSGCGFEWAWDDLVDGVCPDCVEEE
jgi:hypothetical protein